jgi:hypothetical protein
MIKSHRLRQVTTTLVVIVATVSLGVGIYHLTHQGLHSGVTELVIAAVLWYIVWQLYKRANLSTKSSWFHRPELVIVGIICSGFLYLGVYHLTHQGLPSGITELSMASLLAMTLYLLT